MSGIAYIIKNADYSNNNLGKVTFLQDVSVESITIVGPDSVEGRAQYKIDYTPVLTTEQGVNWSIIDGNDYATIDANGKVMVKSGVTAKPVTIRATSIFNSELVVEKTVSVTFVQFPTSLTINGATSPASTTSKYTVAYTPDDTTERAVNWSIIDGIDYATIDGDGNLSIASNASGAKVVIKVECSADESIYSTKAITATYYTGSQNPIVYKLTNASATTAPTEIANNGSINIVLAGEEGYNIPYKVKVENADLVSYDNSNGRLSIANPNGGVIIRAEGYNDDTGIIFDDAAVQELCVLNWDANDDGKFTFGEAKTVSSVNQSFRGNTAITSFNEFELFTNHKGSLGDHNFRECTNLKEIKLPAQITGVTYHSFEGCSSLESIDLSNVVTISDAFKNCTSLKYVKLNDSMTQIGKNAFVNCSSLESIELPSELTSILSGAFDSCGLKVVELPSKLTNLSNTAFTKCRNLEKLYIPSSLSTIDGLGESVGRNVGGVTLYMNAENPPTLNVTSFGWNTTVKAIIVPSASAVTKYKAATNWSNFADIIQVK